ncbi:Decarbamoylnovobiocin carbamoyltransferase [Streptomyces sp. YIM 130001]|uniref:carbamoyltransferase family protein n=1 Tax=Streptomyces sp. YIM 130001 TaxID=2259644 RepID=UPI000E65C3F1|nr:carbamoyltransferase C-terminal domain-containing protein [Streptomyces sp. YIM 130001]RII20949.1 Decarbamoylnovobiocin carbamoyltransferase [Streptomyces sp. YIM 130001]
MIVLGCNGFTRVSEVFAEHFGAVGKDKHYLLGHDAAASLLVDGELVAAVEEERLNREKKTTDFPVRSIAWCLEQAGLQFSDIDLIAIPFDFSAGVLDEMLSGIVSAPVPPAAKLQLLGSIGTLYSEVVSHEAILADFAARTGFTPDPDKVVFVPHHLAHAMTGYYAAGMRDSAFLISDGRAEVLSTLTGEIRDGRVRVFEESAIGAEYSMGMLFSAITRFLGFVPNNDEYKVMGLSGYADPPSPNPFVEQFVELGDQGTYRFARPLETDNPQSLDPLFEEYFGPFRDSLEYRSRVAAAAQEMLSVVTRHQLRALEARTDLDHLLFEGGVALNCLNNTPLLQSSRFDDMDVSFGASDTGVTLGAAVHAWLHHPDSAGEPRPAHRVTPYLGPEYDDSVIEKALAECDGRIEWRRLSGDEEVVEKVAQLLTEKVVIGWYEGRLEHGPRALGHRSILANPNFPDIKDVINTRVKHREPFRPFAPIVLESDAPKIFDMGRKTRSPYMTFVFPVRPEFQDVIPGATHVDGTSRVQTVTDEDTPRLASLLRRFTALTDVPCLLNTSFNVAGEPIVCTPADALKCFLGTEIDHLVLGDYLVSKTGTPA